MKYLTLYIIIAVLVSCHFLEAQDAGCSEPFEAYDTITTQGNFIKYHIKNKKAELEYGNHDYRNLFPEDFDCDIADAWVPKLKHDNKNFMLLHYGCGSSCWGLIFLPLSNEGKIRKIMYDFAYDPETTDLVYTDNENLLIENLTSGRVQVIKLPQCCAANMVYCLDSVSINKLELKYQFYGPNRFDDKPLMKSYSVRVE
jgi:hypothetical protein